MNYLIKKTFTVTNDEDGNQISKVENDFSEWKVGPRSSTKVLPRGGEHIFLKGPETKYPKIAEVDGELVIVEDLKPKDIAEKKVAVDTKTIVKAIQYFGKTNVSNLLARANSYTLRVLAPEKYLDLNLKAKFAVGVFQIGDLLDTSEKIHDYYLEILVDIDKYRITQVNELRALKKA